MKKNCQRSKCIAQFPEEISRFYKRSCFHIFDFHCNICTNLLSSISIINNNTQPNFDIILWNCYCYYTMLLSESCVFFLIVLQWFSLIFWGKIQFFIFHPTHNTKTVTTIRQIPGTTYRVPLCLTYVFNSEIFALLVIQVMRYLIPMQIFE